MGSMDELDERRQVTMLARRPIPTLMPMPMSFQWSSVAMSRCRISMIACDPSMRYWACRHFRWS